MKVYIVIEEDMVGARAVIAADTREKCEKRLFQEFNQDLRSLGNGVYRCGSSVISIQELDLE
jgi:hypothetical protein